MNREIKFRAWNGDLKKPFMAVQGESDLETLYSFMFHFADNATLMQYTGLKDCKGKEIFEGDIIKYTQHHFNTDIIKVKQKPVEWKYDKWGVYETNAGMSDVEVVGNIYENPELL